MSDTTPILRPLARVFASMPNTSSIRTRAFCLSSTDATTNPTCSTTRPHRSRKSTVWPCKRTWKRCQKTPSLSTCRQNCGTFRVRRPGRTRRLAISLPRSSRNRPCNRWLCRQQTWCITGTSMGWKMTMALRWKWSRNSSSQRRISGPRRWVQQITTVDRLPVQILRQTPCKTHF